MNDESRPETAGTGRRSWRIGELAKAAGVSVRALHHYDRLGLLRPSSRSSAGHRLYLADDVRRLHRILAIRGFGLSLTEVRQVIDGDVVDPHELIQQQLQQVEEQIAIATELQRRLRRVLNGLDGSHEPSPQTLIELMEVMKMNRQLTAEEFNGMTQQRKLWADTMTPEQFAQANAARTSAAAELSADERERMNAHRSGLRPDNS